MMWAIEHADDAGVDDEPFQIAVPAAASASSAVATAVASVVAASPAAALTAAPAGPVRFSLFPADTPFKLVLVVRNDLHMRTGKIAAQVAHAAVGTVMDLQELAAASGGANAAAAATSSSVSAVLASNSSRALFSWLHQGQAKVVLQVGSAAELHSLEERARARGLATHIVADAGRTQIAAGSETVLAVGPGPIALVDEITGGLKLL